jgi:hypothetical protein
MTLLQLYHCGGIPYYHHHTYALGGDGSWDYRAILPQDLYRAAGSGVVVDERAESYSVKSRGFRGRTARPWRMGPGADLQRLATISPW